MLNDFFKIMYLSLVISLLTSLIAVLFISGIGILFMSIVSFFSNILNGNPGDILFWGKADVAKSITALCSGILLAASPHYISLFINRYILKDKDKKEYAKIDTASLSLLKWRK